MKTHEKEASDRYGVDVRRCKIKVVMESHYYINVNGYTAGWIIETPEFCKALVPVFYKAKKQRYDNNDDNWIRFDSSKEAIGYIVSEYIKPDKPDKPELRKENHDRS